jgi:hypothetical protein
MRLNVKAVGATVALSLGHGVVGGRTDWTSISMPLPHLGTVVGLCSVLASQWYGLEDNAEVIWNVRSAASNQSPSFGNGSGFLSEFFLRLSDFCNETKQ